MIIFYITLTFINKKIGYVMDLPLLSSSFKTTDVAPFLLKYITEFYETIQTRAIIIDMNFYNVNQDYFAASEIIIEKLPIGK